MADWYPPLKIKILENYEGDNPGYAHNGDAGFDLRAAIQKTEFIYPGQRMLVPTGIKCAVPVGYELQIRPRSGLALKHGVTVLNTPGTIDSGYRGEIGVILINHDLEKTVQIDPGDRIAQAVLTRFTKAEFWIVDELDDTARGDGGFGSSGIA